MASFPLLKLPMDILYMLPDHLNSFENLLNLTATCRTLNALYEQNLPKSKILKLADKYPDKEFLAPHPLFIILVSARSVADWVLNDAVNGEELLNKALDGGMMGLYRFCVEDGVVTLQDMRRLLRARRTFIRAMAWEFDHQTLTNAKYHDPPYYNANLDELYGLNGGGATTGRQPLPPTPGVDRAFEWLIFGQLFATTYQSHIEPEKNLPRLSRDTLVYYLRHCMPWGDHIFPEHSYPDQKCGNASIRTAWYVRDSWERLCRDSWERLCRVRPWHRRDWHDCMLTKTGRDAAVIVWLISRLQFELEGPTAS